MKSLDCILDQPDVRDLYKRTLLLSIFKKICVKMNNDSGYKSKIHTLFRETFDPIITVKRIIEQECDTSLEREELAILLPWFVAHLRKKPQRNPSFTNISAKKALYEKQNGICASCGEPLGTQWNKIHVDHIIPFMLVGDELEDNYQALCSTCNECKSNKTDFLFQKLIKLK